MPTVPGSPSADTPHQPGAIAPHQEALGLTPVFTKQAAGEMVDPNWKWDSGIDPNPDHQAPLHYGDPLEYPKVNDTAAKIDTGWSSMDESDPGQRAMMRQAIVNAFRAVLLSPRKDLRWNAAHYQDISHIPAEVDDPKIYWDALEHKRRQHNQARGRHPDAHLIYYKPRQRYYQLVQMMNPDLSHDEAITKADKAIFQMRLHETERLEEEDAQKSPDKHRSGDEIERRVNESIAKRLKQIVDEAYDPKTDVAEQEQQTLFSGNRKNEQYDIFTGEPAEFYGAWMGTHLKAIAEISRHADELLDAAIQDVRQHDGTGHLFRTKVLQLGIPGAGPKVASFAWLLLQPMTSQLGTIDTHMMDVLGRPYEKEMNNRDYFKFERELQAGRDAAGYGNVPLGQFQWGLWDYKRTGPGSHQDHSALRVLDPTPHNDIDWAQKAQNLKADSWLKQAPEWWQATQDARDQVAQHWDDTMARTVPATNYPFATLPQVMSAEAEVPIAQNSRMQRLKEQHGLTTEEIWALDPDEDEQGEQVKVEA